MTEIQTSVYGLITLVDTRGRVILKISTTVNGDKPESLCEQLKQFWPTSHSVIQRMAIANHFGSFDSLVIMSRREVLASGFTGTDAEFEVRHPRYRTMFRYPQFHPEWNNRNAERVVVLAV